jgi:hypothetical protein
MANRLISVNNFLIDDDNNYSNIQNKNTGLDNKRSQDEILLTEMTNYETDIQNVIDKESFYQSKDIGFVSPTSSAFLKLKDNGDIDLYSNELTGISFKNLNNTISLSAQNLNINSKTINIHTDDMGLRLNDFALNPLLYKSCLNDFNKEEYRDLKVRTSVRKWNTSTMGEGWMREDILIKPFFPTKLAEEQKELDKVIGWSLDD